MEIANITKYTKSEIARTCEVFNDIGDSDAVETYLKLRMMKEIALRGMSIIGERIEESSSIGDAKIIVSNKVTSENFDKDFSAYERTIADIDKKIDAMTLSLRLSRQSILEMVEQEKFYLRSKGEVSSQFSKIISVRLGK